MKQVLVIIEEGEGNFSSYSPDLPGCVATGDSYEEVLQNMSEAIQMHLKGLRESGEKLPKTFSMATYIAVPDPSIAVS